MTVTLGSLTLEGDNKSFIDDNSGKKESLLTPMPLYTKDSNETEVFDYGGTIKTIHLSGIFIGSTKAECLQFITDIESFINGEQDDTVTFSDPDFRGTLYVKVQNVETIKQRGEPLIVRWNVSLIEGMQGV